MAYYIGTKLQCEAYNQVVTAGENYQGSTARWSEPRKHPTQVLYAIVKHDNYSSDMQEEAVLTEDWNDNEQIP